MASFLSDARAKLQHNNRVSFAPRDLKALAELISTEKSVVSAVSRLSGEERRAADALKEWGLGEGDDLADVLSKLAGLFGHLADAQVRFANHISTERLHHKNVRLREENLASLKKSRDALGSKIMAMEKKLSKMNQENKELPTLTARYEEAKGEMVGLEHSVANEEARLADFKRETVREAMGLKLGALLEMAEKMTIVSELGRFLVDEVPMDRTEPGGVRPPYYGAEKTQAIVNEAQRCLAEVTFNPTGGSGRRPIDPDNSAEMVSPDINGNHNPDQDQDRSRFNLPPIDSSDAFAGGPRDGEVPATEESPYGGFDPKHQSVMPGQSGLPYASDAPPVPPIPSTPKGDTKSKRSGSPPPKIDYDFVSSPIQVNTSEAAPFSRSDYDPIKAAAQAHTRKPSATIDSYYGTSGDQYFAQAQPGAGRASPAPPTPIEKSAPPTPKQEVPPSPRGPAGRPPAVRGDSALGSRHGFDSLDYGAAVDLVPPRPGYGAGSRYATADANSFNSSREGKRVNAGAFRRPAPSYSTGPSGYQGPPPSLGPSASESIKQQYMQRWSNDEEPPPDGVGEEMPRQTAPLKVSKRRSITPEPPRDPEGSGPQTGPPPPEYQDAPPAPMSPSTGFGQDRFVTKLD